MPFWNNADTMVHRSYETVIVLDLTYLADGPGLLAHYSDVIMGMMASEITSLTIVYSSICSGADERKHQSSASLAFVRGIHRYREKCFHLMTSSCFGATYTCHVTSLELVHPWHCRRANDATLNTTGAYIILIQKLILQPKSTKTRAFLMKQTARNE